MDYKADIRFIDSKAKSDSSDHYFGSSFHPVPLHSLALSIEHPRMVVVAAKRVVPPQEQRRLLTLLT